MKIVADESVDAGIVKLLRSYNVIMISIAETKSGITDEEVLEIANYENALLITEDKDFGELTHRLKLKHKGILLLRLSGLKREERLNIAAKSILEYYNQLQNNFAVLNPNSLRIKKY